MIKYRATIRHHEIRGARFVNCSGVDLQFAKKLAELEFSNCRRDAEIVILGYREKGAPEIYAS